MDIRFCTICNESIPDGEFEAGRAIVSGDRSQHVACALKRTVEMGGWRSWITFLLALFAAGVSAYLLAVHVTEAGKARTPAQVPQVVREHVAQEVGASEGRQAAALARQAETLSAGLAETLKTKLADHATEMRQATTEAIDTQVRRSEQEVGARVRSVDLKTAKLEQQMADLVDWKLRIQHEADQLRRELELAKRRQPSAPQPETPGATPPTEQEAKPPAARPEQDEQRLKEIERWRKRLKDPDEDVVFSATIELARLKALEATADLVEVLNKHKDFYARLGAATALGEIQACDAVPDLIEALNDKDDLVRTAAAEALQRITEQDFNFVSGLTKNERIRIQKKYRAWWRDHEDEVRTKLHQQRKS